MHQKNIVVVGVARSGTSLTAAVFARSGYFVGDIEKRHLREGDDGNPFGYFEADEVVARNVEVLGAAGFSHHNTWMFDEISEESIRRIEEMEPTEAHRRFIERYDRQSPWTWKDPRLCFTLAYWWKLMDQKTTGVVLVRRDFSQIYNSFLRKGWCKSGKAARERLRGRIARHLRAAEDAIRRLGIPYVEIEYDGLLRDPYTFARRISDFCGASCSADLLNVRPELNHSTPRGRIATSIRRSLDQGCLRRVRFFKPWVPACVLSALLPEKRFERRKSEEIGLMSRQNGRRFDGVRPVETSPSVPRVPMVITVDVEPDDAWADHQNGGLSNIIELLQLQQVLDRWGAKATLLLTHSVVQDARSRDIVARLACEHGAEIGSHLHPWENPPFLRNGKDRRFPCFPHELPIGSFAAKLERLTEAIESRLCRPRCYRAGRWGVCGEHVRVLETLGYEVDSSVIPLKDWRGTMGIPSREGGVGGPDFRFAPLKPYRPRYDDVTRVGDSKLVELPVTVGFTRVAPSLFYRWYGAVPEIGRRALRKTELLRPVWCSPGEASDDWLRRLLSVSLSRGVSHINMVLHSSELMLGGSPNTRTKTDVEAVFRRIGLVLELAARSGRCVFHTMTSCVQSLAESPATRPSFASQRVEIRSDEEPVAGPGVRVSRLVS